MLSKFIDRLKARIPLTAPIQDASLLSAARDMTDSRHPANIGIVIIVIGLASFFLWAFIAPLDEGVPADGVVTVESKRKVVQHLTGGIIKSVLVREAQEVKSGAPLILLDDTIAKANFDASRQQYLSLQAQVDRLRAESIGAKHITFSPFLLDMRDDAFAHECMASQQKLFETRRTALKGEEAILAASARSTEEQIKGLQAQAQGKREQLKLVSEQLKGSRQLAEEGYLARNRWFEDERLASELIASATELESSVLRAQSMTLESRQRLAQRQRDFQKEVETQLSEASRDAILAAEKFRSAREEFLRTVIRAPSDGFVNGLTALTEGSVVTPAGRLMDIVPRDEALILEVQINPNFIDRVQAGMPVAINLSAFADDPSLVLDGILDAVSPDLISDGNPNIPPHYLGRIRVTSVGLMKLGSRSLQPGMPVQVTIRTGERTLAQYLLKPLLRRLAVSMKEA